MVSEVGSISSDLEMSTVCFAGSPPSTENVLSLTTDCFAAGESDTRPSTLPTTDDLPLVGEAFTAAIIMRPSTAGAGNGQIWQRTSYPVVLFRGPKSSPRDLGHCATDSREEVVADHLRSVDKSADAALCTNTVSACPPSHCDRKIFREDSGSGPLMCRVCSPERGSSDRPRTSSTAAERTSGHLAEVAALGIESQSARGPNPDEYSGSGRLNYRVCSPAEFVVRNVVRRSACESRAQLQN